LLPHKKYLPAGSPRGEAAGRQETYPLARIKTRLRYKPFYRVHYISFFIVFNFYFRSKNKNHSQPEQTPEFFQLYGWGKKKEKW
jgi:hypothetical protein